MGLGGDGGCCCWTIGCTGCTGFGGGDATIRCFFSTGFATSFCTIGFDSALVIGSTAGVEVVATLPLDCFSDSFDEISTFFDSIGTTTTFASTGSDDSAGFCVLSEVTETDFLRFGDTEFDRDDVTDESLGTGFVELEFDDEEEEDDDRFLYAI